MSLSPHPRPRRTSKETSLVQKATTKEIIIPEHYYRWFFKYLTTYTIKKRTKKRYQCNGRTPRSRPGNHSLPFSNARHTRYIRFSHERHTDGFRMGSNKYNAIWWWSKWCNIQRRIRWSWQHSSVVGIQKSKHVTCGDDSLRRIGHRGKGTQKWNCVTFNIVGQWSLPLQRWRQCYKLPWPWYLWNMCRGGASSSRANGERTSPRTDNNYGKSSTGTATTRRQWTEKRLTIGLPVHGCTWSKYTSD